MEFHSLINWMSQFQVQEMLGSTFQFQSSFKCAFCEQTVQNQIRHGSAMSDLVLHCLPVSHKKDTRLKWVYHYYRNHGIYSSRNLFFLWKEKMFTLNARIATKVICFSRLLKCLRSLYGKQCGPRSDCSYRSSLFWVHSDCFYT